MQKEEPLEGLPVGREAPVATVSPPKKKSSGKVLLAVFLVIVLLGTLLTLFLVCLPPSSGAVTLHVCSSNVTHKYNLTPSLPPPLPHFPSTCHLQERSHA
jgi:hypothetical protein